MTDKDGKTSCMPEDNGGRPTVVVASGPSDLPPLPPLPGIYPRDAISGPSTVLYAPADSTVAALETAKALPTVVDGATVIPPRLLHDKGAVSTSDVDEPDEGDHTESDEGDEWTTDEDAEKLRETAKYDAEIYHQLGEFGFADTERYDGPATGRTLFPDEVSVQPYEMRRRPKKGCVVCWAITRKMCARCRSVRYCSKECQAEAWPLHKDHCNHYRYIVRYLIPEVVD